MPAHPVRTTRYPTRDMPVASLLFKNTFVFSGYAVCFFLTDSICRPIPQPCFPQDTPRKSVCHAAKVPAWSVYRFPIPACLMSCAGYRCWFRQHTAVSTLLSHLAEFLLLSYSPCLPPWNLLPGIALAITIPCNSQCYADITYLLI